MTRNVLNIAMTVILLVVMNYRFMGNQIHEIAGLSLTTLYLFHMTLNWRWYKSFWGKWQTSRRTITNLVSLFLVAMMIVTFVSGVLISQTIFAQFGRQGGILAHEVHRMTAYAGFVLTAVHLGLQWETLMTRALSWLAIDGMSPGYTMVSRSATFFVIGYGFYASLTQDIGAKLLMRHTFADWQTAPSLVGFTLDYVSMMGCYIGVTHYFLRFLKKNDYVSCG